MAYYFMVKGKNNQQMALDISKSRFFNRLSIFKNEKYSLSEIDNFTMMFNDEEELKKILIEEGILPIELVNRELTIRWGGNGHYKKVMYDLFFQKDIIYIKNPKLLIQRIVNKLDVKDYRFIKEFASYFSNYHEVGATAPEVREFAKDSAIFQRTSNHFYDRDENGDIPLVRMCKLLIYKHTTNRNGTVTYYANVNYSNLHKILAFINHYDKKYLKKKEEEIKHSEEITHYQENFFDMQARRAFVQKEDEQINNSEIQASCKKRVLKPVYGKQISLFDINE